MTLEIGAKIKQLRTLRSLTQEQLGAALGVSAQAVSKWESGATMPDIQLLPELSVLLGASIDALFSMTDERRLDRLENMLEDVRFLSEAEFADAERFLTEQLQHGQTCARATLLLATLYTKRAAEYNDKARPLARQALLRNPTAKAAHNAIYDAERCTYPDWNVSNHWELIDFYKDFLQQHPDDRPAHLWLLDLLIADGRTAEAEAYLARLEQLEHTYQIDLYRGLIAKAECDLPRALACWQRMAEAFPALWQVWFVRANAMAQLGRYEEALQFYARALEMQPHPKYIDAPEAMAQIAEIRGDCAAAISFREMCIELCRTEWELVDGELVDCHRREIARLREKLTPS